jgi:hypothetical protein
MMNVTFVLQLENGAWVVDPDVVEGMSARLEEWLVPIFLTREEEDRFVGVEEMFDEA